MRPCQFSPIQYLQQLNRLAGTAKYLKIRVRPVSQRVRVRVLRKSTKSHSRARHGDSRTPTLIKAGAEKWAAEAAATSQFTPAPPQRRLYFLPEPHGQGSFRSVFGRSAPTVVVKITPFQDDPLGRRFSRGLVAGRGFGWSERSQAQSDLLGHLERAIAGARPRCHWQRTPLLQRNRGRSRRTRIHPHLRDLRAARQTAGRAFN